MYVYISLYSIPLYFTVATPSYVRYNHPPSLRMTSTSFQTSLKSNDDNNDNCNFPIFLSFPIDWMNIIVYK